MSENLQMATEYARQAQSKASKIKNKHLISESLHNLGKVYFSFGLMDSAAWYFDTYLERIRKGGTPLQLCVAYNSIGAVYLQLEDFPRSQKYFELSMEEFENYCQLHPSSLKINKAYILNNLGLIAKEQKNYPTALGYLLQGIRFANRFADEFPIKSMLYNNLGNIYYLINKPDSALHCYQKALEIRLGSQDLLGITASYRNIGSFYLEENQLDSALFYIRKAYLAATKVNSFTQISYCAEYLYKIYDKEKKPDSALKYLKIAFDMKVKERSESAARELAKREMLFEFMEKEHLNRAEDLQNRYLLWTIISIFAIIIMVIFYRYILARRKIKIKQLETEEISSNAEQILNENEKIKSEFENINRKMALHSMKSLQKETLMTQLAEKLVNINKSLDPKVASEIGSLINSLDKTRERMVWKEFEFHFLQINPGFYDQLYTINPKLTASEKRLCAFLKMGLSTKEISDISGRSIDSINKSRIRLRQKLSITNNSIRTTEFLNTIS